MTWLSQALAGILVPLLGVAALGGGSKGIENQATDEQAQRPIAQGLESWVGKQAVVKYWAGLDGQRVAGGNVFRVYTISRVDGVRVKLDADGFSGWIKAADVVLLDQAIDFCTHEIQRSRRSLEARLIARTSGITSVKGRRLLTTFPRPSGSDLRMP